jgi:hypothetical protein
MRRASERDSHLIGLPIGPRHGSRGFDLPGWKRTETKTTAAPLAAGLAEPRSRAGGRTGRKDYKTAM